MPTYREEYFSLLKQNNKYLHKSVIISILLDASDFSDRMSLYCHFDETVHNIDKVRINSSKVANGEPLQYVLGYTDFLGHRIEVDSSVLIPRQETGHLVLHCGQFIKELFGEKPIVIADVCTGSGCIAIDIKSQFPNAKVFATDIDEKVIKKAGINAKINEKDIEFVCGNMLDCLIERGIKLNALICNPPYIDGPSTIDEQVWKYEPHLALLASPNTRFYEEIFSKANEIMVGTWFMGFEIGEDMQNSLETLIVKYFGEIHHAFVKDIYGKTRFLYIINK